MIVVVETALQCTLGVVDAEGNVTNKQPVNLILPALKKDIFDAALEQLLKTKAEFAEAVAKGTQPVQEVEAQEVKKAKK